MTADLLRKDVVARARVFKDVPTHVPLLEIATHWVHIAGALTLFYFYCRWWLYLPLLLFISARQYGLAILLHDAQHTLLHPARIMNTRIATWLISAPLGTEFAGSQKSHLEHHSHLGEVDRDPDYALYCYGKPTPKQNNLQVILLFAARIVGGKVFSMLLANAGPGQPAAGDACARGGRARSNEMALRLFQAGRRFGPMILVQLLFLACFTIAFGWWGYFALWFLPLATLAVFYNDFRIFCEHSLVGREAVSKDERMISFISNPLERFFIAPNHMNHHAEHHLFPFVPHSHLPALRRVIRACPELNESITWRRSYFGHLAAYLKSFRPVRAEAGLDCNV
jgi:fatty acid desaturase